jgi:hypothetical protein
MGPGNLNNPLGQRRMLPSALLSLYAPGTKVTGSCEETAFSGYNLFDPTMNVYSIPAECSNIDGVVDVSVTDVDNTCELLGWMELLPAQYAAII